MNQLNFLLSKDLRMLLGICGTTVKNCVDRGYLHPIKLRGTFFFDPVEVRAFVAKYPELSKPGRPRKARPQPAAEEVTSNERI